MMVNIRDNYWVIGGSTTEVYSSKTNTLVPVDDQTYVDWTAAYGAATPIASEAELADVLKAYNLLPAWLFNAASFIQPTPTTYSKEQLAAYSPDKRWRKEQGGITLSSGMPVKTDDRAQAKITGVFVAAQQAPTVITPWHAADGTVQQLDGNQLVAMNNDLLTHINNCFSVSADVLAQIEAGTITSLEQIDAAFDAPMTQERRDWLKT
jgi:hypothetical protein